MSPTCQAFPVPSLHGNYCFRGIPSNNGLALIVCPVPVYSQTYFDFNYPDLSRWTKTIPHAPRACFITFGTGLSYFACAPGHGSTWAGISSELMDKVQKAFDTPSCVALGMNEAWCVLWPDGSISWKLYGNYGGLDEILTKAIPGSVSVSAKMTVFGVAREKC